MDERTIKLVQAAIGLSAGVSALLVVGGGVAAALEPHVWPSVLVGLPVGVTAGIETSVITYFGLTYRVERAAGELSREAAIRFRAAVAAAVGSVVAGGLAAGVFFLGGGSTGLLLLVVGPPIAAIAIGALAVRRLRRHGTNGRSGRE